ncbi:hypothetical protein EJ06DRAFT_585873 [Trichodelitschia bisporula]|uniref:Uncharacterized protein n=1 Tax=Trichodelitschia bisporula TaxID=703511 RepID=A0A6G1HHL1_9PEZI|nr:hypothetical protein EJ06DRAFT_585873 [Trichodelitschia bisporula]
MTTTTAATAVSSSSSASAVLPSSSSSSSSGSHDWDDDFRPRRSIVNLRAADMYHISGQDDEYEPRQDRSHRIPLVWQPLWQAIGLDVNKAEMIRPMSQEHHAYLTRVLLYDQAWENFMKSDDMKAAINSGDAEHVQGVVMSKMLQLEKLFHVEGDTASANFNPATRIAKYHKAVGIYEGKLKDWDHPMVSTPAQRYKLAEKLAGQFSAAALSHGLQPSPWTRRGQKKSGPARAERKKKK